MIVLSVILTMNCLNLTRNYGISVFEFGHKWISERFRGNHVRNMYFNDQENTLTLGSLNLTDDMFNTFMTGVR